MPDDDSVHLQNSGTINMHGSIIGGRSHRVGGAGAADQGVDPSQLFALLTSIRITAASATDLLPETQVQVIGGAAEAQRRLSAGDVDGASAVLLRTRVALGTLTEASLTAATLRELVETALDLASFGVG